MEMQAIKISKNENKCMKLYIFSKFLENMQENISINIMDNIKRIAVKYLFKFQELKVLLLIIDSFNNLKEKNK